MTKVQHVYNLTRPLEDHDLEGIRKAHSVYGMLRVQAAAANQLIVEWDASRLAQDDVDAVLATHGLPAVK
ncbi:MAG: hypothetical protein K2X35_20460 [Bryobacteraceae bacterium]|nr:hypothetical protein [Bryobacteraceae bacterium]